MNAIEIKNLSKCIGKNDFLLDNISLSLEDGMVLAVVGYNGSGKTTLLETIIGASSIDKGEIFIFGEKFTEGMRNDIGVVLSENFGIFEFFNVDELNELMNESFKNWERDVFYEYIKKFNLPNDKPYYQLSTGERKKVDIAVALSHRAKLLVLDEPTVYLDAKASSEVLDILNEYRADNHSIVIVTHLLNELARICDYIAILDDGKLSIFEQVDVLVDKYCSVTTTTEKLKNIDASAILYQKSLGQLSVEAIVEREKLPKGLCDIEPVTIDELAIHLL